MVATVALSVPLAATAQMAAGAGKAIPPTSETSTGSSPTPKTRAPSTGHKASPATAGKSPSPAATSKSFTTGKKAPAQPGAAGPKSRPPTTDEKKPGSQTGGQDASQKSGPPSPTTNSAPSQQYTRPAYGMPPTGQYPPAPYGQYPPGYGVPPQYAYPPRQGAAYPGQPPYTGYPGQMTYPPQYPQGAYPPQYRPAQGAYPPGQTAYPPSAIPGQYPQQPGYAKPTAPSGAYPPQTPPGAYPQQPTYPPQQAGYPKQPAQPIYTGVQPTNLQPPTTGNLGPDNKSVQKDNMSDFLSLVGSARQMITSGDSAFAVESLNKAVALRPRNLSVYFYRGLAYDESGDPSKAVKNYLESIDRAKTVGMDSAELRINLGNSYMKLAFIKDAIIEYKRAIEIDPGNRNAHLQLGRAYLAEGKYAEALKSFRTCDSLGFNEPTLPYLKALGLAAQGEKQGALGELAPLLSEETEKQHPELYKSAKELKSELK